jgi:hypothetical protein
MTTKTKPTSEEDLATILALEEPLRALLPRIKTAAEAAMRLYELGYPGAGDVSDAYDGPLGELLERVMEFRDYVQGRLAPA